jgi:hypothetical protein
MKTKSTITTISLLFIAILYSCNNKNSKSDKAFEVDINPVGVWVSKVYSEEHDDTIPIFLKLSENGDAYYNNSYPFSGTYKIVKDTLYFEYISEEDPIDGLQKTWFKIQEDSTLLSEWGNNVFIKVSDDVSFLKNLIGVYGYSRADEQGVYDFTFTIQDESTAHGNGLDELFGAIREEQYSGYYHLERNAIYFVGYSEGDVVKYKFKIDDDTLILVENSKNVNLQPKLQKANNSLIHNKLHNNNISQSNKRGVNISSEKDFRTYINNRSFYSKVDDMIFRYEDSNNTVYFKDTPVGTMKVGEHTYIGTDALIVFYVYVPSRGKPIKFSFFAPHQFFDEEGREYELR